MTQRIGSLALFVTAGLGTVFPAAPVPNPTAAPTAIISGVVLGADAKPVAGAVITACAPSEFNDPPILARTDAEGAFRVECRRQGAHTVRVESRGLAPQTIEKAMPGTPLRVTLSPSGGGVPSPQPGPQIRGRVRDPSGAPVTNARVRGFTDGPDANCGPPLEARTQTDGTFVLDRASAPRYRLNVEVTGFAPLHRVVDAPRDGVVLRLSDAGGITGLVVDDGDRPVESFTVTAESSPRGSSRMQLVTSENGRFTLDEMQPGTYTVEVTTVEQGRRLVSKIDVGRGAITDVGRIRLSSGGSLHGTVLDAASAPVAEAQIEVRGSGPAGSGTPENEQTTTDAAGVFQLRGLRPEKVVVIVRHPDFAEGRSAPVEIPAEGTAETSVVLGRGGRIEGVIRRRGPGPPPEVSISVQLLPGGGSFIPYATPRPDGTFVIDHVPPGRVAVVTMTQSGPDPSPSGELSKEVEVREGETTRVEFVWREILLTGRVTRGRIPLANIRLVARSLTGRMSGGGNRGIPAPSAGPQRMIALTREDGTYQMIVADVGRTAISAESAVAHAPFPVREIEVADVDSQTVDIAYPAGGISGVVVDEETRAPLAQARVLALSTGPGAPRGGSAITGEDGRFVIDVDAGEFNVGAAAEGYAGADAMAIVGDSPAPDVRIALPRGVTIRGRVLDSRGRPAPGLSLMAVEETAHGRGRTESGPDGSFAFSSLRIGRYAIAGGSPQAGYGMLTGVTPGPAEVVLQLSPGGRIRVSATKGSHTPVEGAFVTVRGMNGSPLEPTGRHERTGDDGVVEIDSPAGLIDIEAWAPGLVGRGQVTATSGGLSALELTMTEAPAPAP